MIWIGIVVGIILFGWWTVRQIDKVFEDFHNDKDERDI